MMTLDEGGRARSTTTAFDVPASLTRWVSESFVSMSGSTANPHAWRVVADDAAYLLWQVNESQTGRDSRLVLVGPRTVAADIDMSRRRATAGVRLRAGALLDLFGVEAHELTDGAVLLELLAGAQSRTLAAQLDAAPIAVAARSINDFLVKRSRRVRSFDARVAALAAARWPATPHALASALGVSPRTLRWLAHRHVGLSVQQSLAIRRLHSALHLAGTASEYRWSEVAARTGYADHAHLTRDATRLLGESPSAFQRRGVLDCRFVQANASR